MPETAAPGRLAGLTVLVVEDETLLAIDYEAMLKAEGCQVMGPAPSEAKALALIERRCPDVAVLDLNLAGRRPVALAEALVSRGVPFLVVSGYGARQTDEPVFRAAPRLDKPLKAPMLIDALERLTGRGGGVESCRARPRAAAAWPEARRSGNGEPMAVGNERRGWR